MTGKRAELFERARAAGIEGYQTMSNAALEAALGNGGARQETETEARRRLGRRFRREAWLRGHQ